MFLHEPYVRSAWAGVPASFSSVFHCFRPCECMCKHAFAGRNTQQLVSWRCNHTGMSLKVRWLKLTIRICSEQNTATAVGWVLCNEYQCIIHFIVGVFIKNFIKNDYTKKRLNLKLVVQKNSKNNFFKNQIFWTQPSSLNAPSWDLVVISNENHQIIPI